MTSWRQRLRDQHGAEARSYLDSLGPGNLDADEYETVLNQQWIDSVSEFESDAHYEEELQIRISGDSVHSGALDFKIGETLLSPLEDGISSTSGRGLSLEMFAISAGSTVIHVRASEAGEALEFDSEELISGAYSSFMDSAVRGFLRMVNAAESRADMREWSGSYASLDKLVDALDKFDLSLGLKWVSRAGSVRSSKLTGQGRSYVRSLRELHSESSRIVIRGRVTELKEAGVVRIKTGSSQTAPAYNVRMSLDDLIALNLVIGQQVAFLVEVTAKLDKLGREKSREFHFLGEEFVLNEPAF